MSSPLSASLPLWRAHQVAAASTDAPARSTGFPALDAVLPGGGWPGNALTELLLDAPGAGELRLLAPVLAAATAPVLWVAPPLVPYAPALTALGLAPERLVIAAAERAADAAWAAEQALRTGALGAVLWWTPHDPVAVPLLRRLQLAAQDGRTPLFAMRSVHVGAHSSPAPLRLQLEVTHPNRLAVTVLKRRGPPLAAPLAIHLPAVPGLRRRAPRRASTAVPPPVSATERSPADAVVRPAPARVAA